MIRPIKTVSSDDPIFDANEALCWVVYMSGSVADARVTHTMPGVLYTFVFRQDGVGGHTFAWPSNCINAAEINTEPNGYTIANFIGAQDAGTIICNAPGARP